jgi:hypothetical protein
MGGLTMRETKFRAYHKERKEMFEIASIDFEEKKAALSNGIIKLLNVDSKQFELLQYTGLKDKNDKEIYEGDILFFRDENMKYIVVWQDTAFIIKSIEIRKYLEKMCWLDDTEICCEIVGNIYENKKLLEENE